MGLRGFFDKLEPAFHKGGKLERLFPVYEMVESFLYTPKTVTTAAPHARSYIDMKRIMTYVVIATIPALVFGLFNLGCQTNMAVQQYGSDDVRVQILKEHDSEQPAAVSLELDPETRMLRWR